MGNFNSAWERADHDQSIRHHEERDGGGNIRFNAIGYITSPHMDPSQIPMLPLALNDAEGTIEIMSEYVLGLKKLEGFKYIHVLYHLHRPPQPQIMVKPPFQNEEFGIFATRFNGRPNAIASSLLELIKIEGPVLHVRGMDMIDGEAVLDIRPYSEDFDVVA